MKIRRNSTDKYFSDLIRERADYKCERCGKDFRDDPQKLHASHFYGRGNKSVRWNVDNASALCGGMAPWGLWGCHKYMTENPAEHYKFMLKRIGKKKMDKLEEKFHKTFKEFGITEEEIRRTLKEELLKLKASRPLILGARS